MRRSPISTRNGTRVSKPVLGAAVAGIIALLVAALLNANAFAASRFLDDSVRFAEAESALVTTQLSLRTLSQAVLLAEDVDLGVADAATAADALGEARRVITELERQVDTLGIDQSAGTPALGLAREVIAALERGDTTEAGVRLASDTLESYKTLRDSIAATRDAASGTLTNARSLARRLGTIAGFLVALLAPAAAVFAYWRIARRQLGRAHIEIGARLRAEKRVLEAKDEFIANVSHELRTPLTSIYGFSEFLVEQGIIDPAEALSLITVINGESAELNRMVEDLLTSARAEAETIAYNCVAIDIAEEAATVVKPFGRMGLTVEIDCASEQVWADQLRTRQILRNLLSNAERWGGENVRITSERIGGTMAVTVADDGPGVPEMVATRLFTRYVHEGSDPLTKGSVGLGLAVVKILATGMGGSISYDRIDGWSRFTFTLPAAATPAGVGVIGAAMTDDAPVAVMRDAGLRPSLGTKVGRVAAATAIIASSLVLTANPALSGPGTYGDDFAQLDYDGSDGTIDWSATPWAEELDGGDPTAGLVQVVNDPTYCETDNCLQLTGNGSVKDRAATRRLDLAGAGYATLSYDYLRFDWWSCRVRVQSRPNASSGWSLLATYPAAGGTDPAPIPASHAIPLADISATTEVRFIVDEWCDPERFYVDNVLIDTDLAGSCYLLGRPSNDELSITDLSDTNPLTNEATIGWASNSTLGVGTVQPGTGTLFVTGPSRLGTVNTGTGEYASVGSSYGAEPGSAGVQGLNDVRGLVFDPTSGILFAVARRSGGPDLLFQVDPTTGSSIPNAFGPGVGYVEVTSDDIPYQDFYGIAITTGGQLVGMANDVGIQWKIHTIDKLTGAAVAGSTWSATSDLSYDSAGNLWAISPGGVLTNVDGSEATRTVDNFPLYSAVACGSASGPANQPPVFDGDLLDRTDAEGTVISLAAGATDPDLDTLLYTATGLPPGLSIDSGSGLISGTINFSAAAASPHAVEIKVTDDGAPNLNATDTFTWTVTDVDVFYAIADTGGGNGGDDLLTGLNPLDFNPVTNEASIGIGTGTVGIQAADFQPGTGTLYASNGDQLGTVDTITGFFAPTSSSYGIANNGDQGAVTLDNVVGVAFDTVTGDLYGVQRRPPGTEPLLFRIAFDGSLVPGAFSGNDYVPIQKQATRIDVSDIAFDPTDGQLYAMHNDLSSNYRLATIDQATGATTTMGGSEDDIQGLAFDATGQLWGTTATGAAESLWQIDKSSGAGSNPRPIDNGGSYEALAIIAAPIIANQPPLFDQDLLDRADAEGTVISLSAGATDPDLDTLLYTATGLPPGLSIDPGSGLISDTIAFTAAAGSPYAVEITVTDNGIPNLDATDTFTWTVTNTNRNPIFNSDLLNRTDGESTVISLAAGATDPDLDTLLYTATGLPPGLTIDSGSGLISGTIDFAAAAGSPYAVEITVTDNGIPNLDATDTFTWTAVNTNRNPVFDTDLLDRADGEAVVVSLAAGATDPDLDTLLFTATGLPTGLSIDSGTGLISGTIDFTAAAGSPYATVVTVTDNGSPNLDATDTFTWTVVNSNRGPVFDGDLLDRTDGEGTVISLSAGATDPDLDGLLYTATELPTGLSIDPGSGLISGTISFAAAAGSPYAVAITATDNGTPNLDATDTFTWTVTNTNRNPIFNSDLLNRTDGEGTVISLAAGATDPDLDTLLHTATGLPTGLSIDPGSGLISGTISFTASTGSPYTVEITVTDNGVPSLDATDTFTWTVTNTNRNPIFDTDLPDRVDAEAAAVTLAAGASDPDFETLLYSATGLPPGLSIAPGSGLITGTIGFTAAADSPFAVEITVTDNGVPNLDATDMFTWTVADTNRNPIFDTDLPDQTDAEGTVVVMSAAATDPDLDTLLYTATGLPPGITINPVTGLIAGTMIFSAAAGSPYAVEVTVTDNGVPNLAAVDTFTWTVADVNRSPIFDSDLLDRADGEAAAISLPATASDPDLDTLTYSASGLPPGLSIDLGSGLISGTISFTAAVGSPYAVEITVTDDRVPNLSAVDTFAWTVVNSNRAPAFNTDLADRTDAEDSVISLSAAAEDPDADTLSYSVTGLPPGLSINRTTGLISGTIDFSAAAGSPYAVAVTATDGGTPSLSAVDTLTWTVTNTNRPPALDPIADIVGAEQTPISFTAIGTDPDLDELVFTLVGAPPGAGIAPGSGIFTWTPTEAQGPGNYSITVVVADSATPPLTDSQIVAVTVAEANRPPSLAPIVDQLHGEGGTIDLTVAGTDPDLPANTLTYRAVGLPPGIVIDPVSGVISGTIDAAAAAGSPYEVEITVTDIGTPELNAVHTFKWTVANVDAPAGVRKKNVVDALVGFEVEAIAEPEARPIRRGLVLMGATASASASALRWPLGILLVLLIGFITIGRIGLYPVLRRGDRFTGVIGFYDEELEFGLVTPDDDSREIFIHANAFSERQRRNLEAGTRVRYRLFTDDNRPCAWAATIIDRRGPERRHVAMIASNCRILVVEDDAGTSRLFDEILRHLGVHVDLVVDGVAALEFIRNEPPDLVILDIALPRLNGWDVLDAMRIGEMAPDVPVVVITAHGQGMSAERAMDKGAQRFFEKPFIPSEVVEAIAGLLATD